MPRLLCLTSLVLFGLPALATPTLRLPGGARPLGYHAELTVDPERDDFSGELTISLRVEATLPSLWLNAEELTVDSAEIDGARATIHAAAHDFVGFDFTPPLPAGKHSLRLRYHAKLSTRDARGAARLLEDGRWYATTQMEPLDARRVFPCFDEPAFKVPWQLALVVPSGDAAFANAAQIADTPARPGWHKVSFAATQPLPSYLLAWAVGPYSVVAAGASKRGAQVRVIVPRGYEAQAAWSASATAPQLSLLEDYFGMRYPYDKLDFINVPAAGFGAMENPGLVTFSQRILLAPAALDNIGRRRGFAATAAHEMAHLWFGDLVTLAWWDDLWLNEAFATWLTFKINGAWQPSWGLAERRVTTRANAISNDVLASARQIRQPIVSNDDVDNAFDPITYSKGASVIYMLERWLGEEVWRRGVLRYMREHAHGNGTTTHFFAAVSDEAKRNLAPIAATFLDQPGVPEVELGLACAPGRPPTLIVHQQRLLPIGSPLGAQARAAVWKLPLCVRYGAGTVEARACVLAESAEGRLPLPALAGDACPTWLAPNDDGAGYYVARLAPHLERREASITERLATARDTVELASAGRMPFADALALVPTWAGDGNRHLVEAAAALVRHAWHHDLVTRERQADFTRFVAAAFGPRARKLGWRPPADARDDEATLLRLAVVPLAAELGEDAALLAEARRLVDGWLANPRSLDGEMLDALLVSAASHGDAKLFDSMLAHLVAANGAEARNLRARLLSGLASFRDPALFARALALVLDERFDIRDTQRVLGDGQRFPEHRQAIFDFIRQHHETLVKRLPRDAGADLPFLVAGLCDAPHRAEAQKFFAPHATRFMGGPRNLAQALERIDLCSALRGAQSAGVGAFLSAPHVR